MSDILLATKVHIPPLHGNLVNRANLVARLNDGIARGCYLTLISAPAGYEKSTLLSEWQAQVDLPVAWLSLEKGENTPARFWSYFVAALNTLPQVHRANIGSAIRHGSAMLRPTWTAMSITFHKMIRVGNH